MTIKALNGGKLLCLMAAVAGVMTLGSCNKDDDDPEPEPAPVVPVDSTPKKIVYPDQFTFRLNNSTPDSLKDTIKANTLLENGVNSDSISVDVVLRNKTMVDPASVSFTVSNTFLGKINVSNNASITDSIYSITFPAIEGSYALSINGKARNFTVVSTGKTSSANRNLSNSIIAKLDSVNKYFYGIEFVPFEKTELTSTVAHLKGAGKFVTLTDEEYNKYLTSALSYVKGDIDDKLATEGKSLLPLKDVKHFVYIANENAIICNIIDFAGAEVAGSDLTMTVTY
ncbi:MAG: hypothetical protein IKV67_11230 [Paludibacteraceae bacterium]|nr:hypothetical protein [Paludibacteraceae bacterium]